MSDSAISGTSAQAIDSMGEQALRIPLHLSTLEIENFRAIGKASFSFRPGLNVIIGENNAAKSAVIDALRLIFSLGTFERKDDYIKIRPTDINTAAISGKDATETPSIRLLATFIGPAGTDLDGQFYEMFSPAESTPAKSVFKLAYLAQFRFHQAKGDYVYSGAEIRGGANYENPVSAETLDGMRAIYLAPLRDLLNDRVRVGAEIERLIIGYTEKGKEAELAAIPGRVRDYTLELIQAVTGNKHHTAAGERFSDYARPYEISSDSIAFSPWGISDGLLRTMLPVFSHMLHGEGVGRLPLSSNGLGLNQLIYASIVLARQGPVDGDSDIVRFFAIEEPEAHLHPQLQDSFFHALNGLNEHQVFVTSHSPSITAKADVERINVLRRGTPDAGVAVHDLSRAFEGRDADRRYLHRFLDVTRSQLLFARGALFVEGVTEAMLMQQFSECLNLSLRDHGIEVVVLDAADGFEHFKPLFATDSPLTRGVLLGDSDVNPADVLDTLRLNGAVLGSMDDSLSVHEGGVTATAIGFGTFEFGLLLAAISGPGNPRMQELLSGSLRKAVRSKVSDDKIESFCADFMSFDSPALTYRKMKKNRSSVGSSGVEDNDWVGTWKTNSYWKKVKADFSFYFSEEIRSLAPADRAGCVTVPRYIRDAIEFLVGREAGQ